VGKTKIIGIGIGAILIAIGIAFGVFDTQQLTEPEIESPDEIFDTQQLTEPGIGTTDGTSTNTTWLVESDGSSSCYKSGGVHGGWDADCVSDEQIYVGGTPGDGTGGYTTFVYDTDDSVSTCTNSVNKGIFMAGLSDSDSSAGYFDVDFAWFAFEGSIYESGTLIGVFVTIDPTTDPTFKISVDDDGTVKYYEGDVLKYTSLTTATANATYEFDSSLLGSRVTICNIIVIENS